jgi:hypothetical protein
MFHQESHMTTISDRAYCARRADEELRLADAATDPAVREVHRAMAREYRARAAGFAEMDREMTVRTSSTRIC